MERWNKKGKFMATVWGLLGGGGGAGGHGGNKRLMEGDLTRAGEHTVQCTEDVFCICTPETV